MVNLFGSSKDKKKEAKEKKHKSKEEKLKSDEDQQESTSATDPQQPLQSHQQQSETTDHPSERQQSQPQDTSDRQPEEAIVSVQNVEEEQEDSPSAAVNNDAGTTSASAQAAGSVSSESSAHERKEGVSQYGSSYQGGVDGRCATCGLVKIACNCQRCHCCNRFVMTLSSRKHCRRCWRATCPKCSPYERVNEFLHGEVSRTCRDCAVPRCLVYLTELAYSSYDSVNAGDIGKKSKSGKDRVENSGGGEASPNVPPPDTHPFRWGLYALGCEMQAPRRCINPACTTPISYDHVCGKCKLATVTLAFHRLRHVEVPELTDTNTASSSKRATVTTEAVEEAVKAEHDTASAARTTAEEDDLFDAALPNDMESYLFASMQGNSWASRKVLLSLVACAVAAESSAMPNISLAMMDVPAYAKLLRPVQVTEAFSVFNAPGHVRFIAFNSCADNRTAIQQILGNRTSAREAWTSSAVKQTKAVAKIVSSANEASTKGLTDCLAKMSVREGVVAYIAENDNVRRLPEEVDKMAKEGLDVVLCGHGVGGAIATWLTSTLLLENTPELKDRLLCVTFGAPLVTNYPLTDLLCANGLHKNFQHFVNASDMVPRMSYVESLLASGNTIGTASLIGHGEGLASAEEVREAVMTWVGMHEEPRGAATASLRTGKDSGFSIANFARRVRSTNGQESKDRKDKKARSADDARLLSITEDRVGDLFRTSREPFDNNIIRDVDETTAPTLHDVDFHRFATPEHREKQTLDPCGCYHFLWHARGKYMCTDDPTTAIGLLSDRTDLRVELHDHLLSSYNKAMVEYIYSVSAEQ